MTDTLTATAADTPEKCREPGHARQTFLVGEEIYLRRIEKADATSTVSWRPTLFPLAPERTETWITEDLSKGETAWYAIVRKVDDVVVGSLKHRRGNLATNVDGYVDPLFGERALHWKAEAFALALPWLIDEQHRVGVHVTVPADEDPVIAALEAAGARRTARFRDAYYRGGERGGHGGKRGRVDQLWFERLNPQWVARLGDPNHVEIARTGQGAPRPVPAKPEIEGDPPKNAIAVGARVYLKPIDKDDAEALARWTRRETDFSFGHSRVLASTSSKIESRLPATKDILPRFISFAVRLRETDEILGDVGLLRVDYVNRFGETYSWMYNPAFRGGGYGFEAKHLLLEYAFDTLGLQMVQSFVAEENTRSAAALRKQGYSEAGRLNWIGATDGTYASDIVFDLLAAEWRALPRATGTGETPRRENHA